VVLLKEYQDVFAWQYDEMPGIDPELVLHLTGFPFFKCKTRH
jgi:hypothetical protein